MLCITFRTKSHGLLSIKNFWEIFAVYADILKQILYLWYPNVLY